MPVNNSSYTRGRAAKTKGAAEKARHDKCHYSQGTQSKFSIRFGKGRIEFISEKRK